MHSGNQEISVSVTKQHFLKVYSSWITLKCMKISAILSEAQKPLLKVLLGNWGNKNKICPFETYDFEL